MTEMVMISKQTAQGDLAILRQIQMPESKGKIEVGQAQLELEQALAEGPK